jgi:hypothetical protein
VTHIDYSHFDEIVPLDAASIGANGPVKAAAR